MIETCITSMSEDDAEIFSRHSHPSNTTFGQPVSMLHQRIWFTSNAKGATRSQKTRPGKEKTKRIDSGFEAKSREGSSSNPLRFESWTRHNVVSLDEANWNIPQGPLVGEEVKIFTVDYDDHGEVFEYRIITNVDAVDARIICQQLGMNLPEPRDEVFNEQLRLFWTVDEEWMGNLFLAGFEMILLYNFNRPITMLDCGI